MKKKLLTISIASIVCIILSILVEVFVFNFKILTLDENNKSIPEVAYTIETQDNDTIIKFNNDNKYINKLVINYTTTETTDYSLSYDYTGTYGKEASQNNIHDKFDKSFSTSITNIDNSVSNVQIQYQTNHQLTINNISIDNDFHFNYFRTIFIFLVLLTVFFLIYFYKDGFRTEKLHIYFATICTLLGLMVIVAQPSATFYSWDDQIHFGETIDWFGGNINYNNGEYNLSNANVLDSAGRESIHSAEEKQQQIDYLNSSINHDFQKTNPPIFSFNKISYLPMAIGYNFSKLIHLPFIVCFQIGKIFNLLFYVLLISYTIKKSKIGKRLIAFVALIPINLFLASNYSYDPAVFAGITVFLVHLFNLLLDQTTKFDFKTTLIIIASMTYACFAKAIYAPFLLLTLLVPKDRFNSPKQSLLVKIGLVAITIMLSILPLFNGSASSDPRGGDTSLNDQIVLVLNHPFDYANVFEDTAIDRFSAELVGADSLTNFAYLNKISSSSNLYILLFIFLIFVFLTDNKDNNLTKKHRIALLGVVLIIIALIWTALYLSFTPVGSDTIKGVQGRYFLPLLLPLLFALQPKNIQNKINPKYYNLIIFTILALVMIFMIYKLILIPYSF
ncbi:DUF2142 domain-containing protein [Candidatus Saccharibacteria bacterium]|nr:DUF2142 domain-containing protein [Candidatus Saccharibacteria bacterium]